MSQEILPLNTCWTKVCDILLDLNGWLNIFCRTSGCWQWPVLMEKPVHRHYWHGYWSLQDSIPVF